MIERWLPAPGYAGFYDVSDMGRVRSVPHVVMRSNGSPYTVRTRILKPGTTESGHKIVSLHADGESSVRLVHRLVLEAFSGSAPDGMICCHGNDIPSDNRLSNLRWDTPKNNALDHVRTGNHNQASKTHCLRGHPFNDENTYWNGNYRQCRTCNRAKRRRIRERKKLAKQSGVIDCTTNKHIERVS